MKRTSPKLPLSAHERKVLRKQKLRLGDVQDFTAADLHQRTGLSLERTQVLCAHAAYQAIPSIGPRFAEDLLFLGYYRLAELAHCDGAELLDAYEQKKGYWTDPCVEDQFRLVVYVAQTGRLDRTWPDFTAARKAFRESHGYPPARPKVAWHEVLAIAK